MTTELRRQLTPTDAVVVGIGSMVGAGVFAVWAPAANAAGTWLLLSLVIAGGVALCNAASSAQLAARHPESGGTYVYARERLSPFWGHVAGWGFIVGKTASCAAMGLTAGLYIWPSQARLVATAAVVLIAAINLGGLARTAFVTRAILGATGLTLVIVVTSGWVQTRPRPVEQLSAISTNPYGVLQAAGLIFFAFAGYARIATFGEEVINPERTIPWAIPRALGAVLLIYLTVAVVVRSSLTPEHISATSAPLSTIVELSQLSRLAPAISVGAGLACFGVLLNLIPGVARTILALGRRADLPAWFAHVSSQRSLPLRAELSVVAVVVALINTVSLTSALSLSGVAVLTYYAITNASALRLQPSERLWTQWGARLGLVGCSVLALALPWQAMVSGVIVIIAGVIARSFAVRSQQAT